MIYALDNNKQLITATVTGQRATDPFSKTEVISKVGEFKIPHWALKSKTDYDNWYEPMTEWHYNWQKYFESEGFILEHIMYNESTGEKHIADCYKNGLVIEVQHSPIKSEEIRSREDFYGNMVWILDATTFFRYDTVRNCLVSKCKFIQAIRKLMIVDISGELFVITNKRNNITYNIEKLGSLENIYTLIRLNTEQLAKEDKAMNEVVDLIDEAIVEHEQKSNKSILEVFGLKEDFIISLPFGKYKDVPIDKVDKQYLNWLCKQEWFINEKQDYYLECVKFI